MRCLKVSLSSHRHSLIFDALEPLRPLIDAKVRVFIESNTFDRGGERPAGAVAHGLGRIDSLCPCGLVDGEWVAAERLGFEVDVWYFGFLYATPILQYEGAISLEALAPYCRI
jgi:hypothetical protein